MRSVRSLVLAAAFFLLAPAVAQASWIDWLERLSGPGPFIGTGPDLNLICFDENNEPHACGNPLTASNVLGSGKELKHSAIVSPEIMVKFPGQRFGDVRDDDGFVGIARANVLYEYRFSSGLSLGAGVGTMRFFGKDFDSFQRYDIVPISANVGLFQNSADLRPWRLIVQLHFIPTGFKTSDFSSTSKSTFDTHGGEWLASIGVNYDLTRK
jgi:hypothetical protein